MSATEPFVNYRGESADEQTATVALTMRELVHIVSSVHANHNWAGYNTGFAIQQKIWQAINRLQKIGDPEMVTRMMAGPVGVEGK